MHRHTMLALIATLATAAPAAAAPFTITDHTLSTAYSRTSPTGYFGGATRGDVIGAHFNTDRIEVTRTELGHGSLGLNLAIHTDFSGLVSFGQVKAYYADLFFRLPGTGAAAGGFTHALTLGYQSPNGGLATAGLYTLNTAKTSYDVWSGRSGFTYGGRFAEAATGPDYAAPVTLTAGTKLAEAMVTKTSDAGGGYLLSIALALDAEHAAPFRGAFDLFWGTGDCDNDAVFGAVPAPEPASVALFGLATLGLGCVRWKAAGAPRTGSPPRTA